MLIQPNEVRGGDILIGHGLLITPALMLDKKLSLDEGRLLDFCTLVNALAIHDRLITLPAEIPQDLKESGLYTYLTKRGILHELDFDYSKFGENETKDMMALFGDVFNKRDADYVMGQLSDSIYKEHSMYKEYYAGYNEYHVNTPTEEQRLNLERSKLIDEIINTGANNLPGGIRSLSEESDLRLHRLRTAAYWEISGMLRLAYLPDFMRIPIISAYNDRLRKNLRICLQGTVDNMIREQIQDAMRFVESTLVPIPPSTTVFLERYHTSSLEAFDGMREEFAEERKTIVKWEEKMQKADKMNLKETLKLISDMNSSMAALKKKNASEILVNVGPGIVTDTLSGSLGPGTAVPLAMEAIGIIDNWLKRRRISYFVTGKKEAETISNQGELLKKAFGSSLTPRQANRFLALTKTLEKLAEPGQ